MINMLKLRFTHRFTTLVRGVASEAGSAKSSKDVFGTLSETGTRALDVKSTEQFYPDDPDGYDKEEYDLTPRKNAYYYKYEISKYARKGSAGLRKALELFHNMKSNDRLTPTLDQFSPLIYGCAKVGYTKRAFELYDESIKYVNKPTQSTVTCLLNACAESPFKEYGLERLNWFINHLKINYSYSMNKIQYHSAIKAYGKLGQLKRASELVQEMIDNGLHPETDTFNMLLIGCASDMEAGAMLALRVYKRLKFFGLKPDIITYRLMLRCIRDCGVGSPELIKQTIGELPAMTNFDQRLKYKRSHRKMKPLDKNFEWIPLIADAASSITDAIEPPTSQAIDVQKLMLVEEPKKEPKDRKDSKLIRFSINKELMNLPQSPSNNVTELANLLSEDHLDLMYRIEAIDFDKLRNGENRLMIFGGLHGYLDTMVRDGCTPDEKTFSLLLGCAKHTIDAQTEYFRLAQDFQIKRDLLFYDLLIRHVCHTFKDKKRLERAFYFIEQMHKDNIRPNISTFESLALGCDNSDQALKLIEDIEKSGFIISNVFIARLFESALYRMDFEYLNDLITVSKRYNLKPVKHLIEELEERRLYAHDMILHYENGDFKAGEVPAWLNAMQIRHFDVFNRRLGSWLKSVEIAEEEHPWSQYHVDSTSKRMGFKKFVEKFTTLNKVKEEAIQRGKGFGNLMSKAERVHELEHKRLSR